MINRIRIVGRLFFYMTKRQLKKRSLWVLFFVFLTGGMFLPNMAQEEGNEIRVGICVGRIEGYAEEEEVSLVQKLENHEGGQGLFSFVVYEEPEKLRQEILSGKLECGYVIPADLWEKLDKGKTRNIVTLYTTATTTLDGICNETVYAEIYVEYALCVLNDYLLETNQLLWKTEEEIKELTEPIYRQYLTNGSTFGFQMKESGVEEPDEIILKENGNNVLLYPLRGFLAIFVLVCGFCGSMMHYEDQEKRIFMRQTRRERTMLRFISISIPVLLSYPVVLGSLWISGLFTNWHKEVISLLFYVVLVILLCGMITYWLKDKVVFCSWIPLLLMGCILFTPVIIDLSAFIPQARFIEKLFVPYYYLRLFL